MASDIEIKAYELGYLLSPLVASDQLEGVFNATFKSKIEKFGGNITGELMPKMIPLAYTVSKHINNKPVKFNEAYFGAFRFELDPAKVAELKELIERTDEALRFLLVKLDKHADKTQLRARLPERHSYYSGTPAEVTEVPEEKVMESATPVSAPKEVLAPVEKTIMSEAEIDKEIDGLLEEAK